MQTHCFEQILEFSRQSNEDGLNACLTLINRCGAEKSKILSYNRDSLFNFSLFSEAYLPAQNSLADVLQSGHLNLLVDEELKNTLLSWSASMDLIKEYYRIQNNWQNNHYKPYLLSAISCQNMNVYNNKS